MPKQIKKRVVKKTISTETEVKDKLFIIRDTLKERQKNVLYFGAGILIIIIAITGIMIYSNTMKKKARILENEAYIIYYNDNNKIYANRAEPYQKAVDIFIKAYDTKKNPFSLFYIAGCYYELGKYDEALKTLKDFIQRFSGHESFIPLAYQKLAMVYVKKGDLNEAMKTYNTISALKPNVYKDFALMEHGRLLEKTGKTDEAKKKYQELTIKFPSSPFFEESKAKLSDKKAL